MNQSRLEASLADAWHLAENSRKAMGYKPRTPVQTLRKRSGVHWTGPSGYRVTMWFRPWLYADLMMAKMTSDKPERSLGGFITETLEKMVPRVAARPEPVDRKGPIRRRTGGAPAVAAAAAAAIAPPTPARKPAPPAAPKNPYSNRFTNRPFSSLSRLR